MPQFYHFSMISRELKAEFRRATRGHDDNAVARQITRVFEDFSRTKINVFAPKSTFPKKTAAAAAAAAALLSMNDDEL